MVTFYLFYSLRSLCIFFIEITVTVNTQTQYQSLSHIENDYLLLTSIILVTLQKLLSLSSTLCAALCSPAFTCPQSSTTLVMQFICKLDTLTDTWGCVFTSERSRILLQAFLLTQHHVSVCPLYRTL